MSATMAEDDIALRLMRLYGLLHSTVEERNKTTIRAEIDRLLAQIQDAARAIEPNRGTGQPEQRRASL